MKKYFILLFCLLIFSPSRASENGKILSDICSVDLYNQTENYFKNNDDITTIRDIRGIILRFELKDSSKNYYNLSRDTLNKIKQINNFLAKIKNPVIIEVHTSEVPKGMRIKNWEFSTVIANNIEEVFIKITPKIQRNRVFAVGYGEFLPEEKNTPYNGGKFTDRVDIIILCKINGD